MYRIVYNEGEITVHVLPAASAYQAHLIDPKNNIDISLAGETENEMYYKCLSWASSNIYGEFMIESMSEPNARAGVAA